MWANWVGAFGVLIEFVGFWTLAYELYQASKSTILETLDLAAEKSDFDRIVLSDAEGEPDGLGHSAVEGGRIGKLLDHIKSREAELRKRMDLIIRGVAVTAIGCLMQMVGSFGQALQSGPPA